MSEQYGQFELIRKLATGGMAQIYLARQRGLDRLCVVKRILPHLAENDDFVQMFLHEAKIAARLNHPNIVQIYDLGRQDEDGSYFIAMEYIHGEDLRRVWKRTEQRSQELPVPFVLRVIADAAAGLDYAHKRTDGGLPLHIVHRDISPQNILVSFEGAVKVVDFGIAKAADADMNTRSGVLKGKYSYMSPEQASGSRDIDHRTDLFALGVVLYELLTGTRLFKRSNDIQTLNAVIECQVAPPSEVNARLPKDLDGVVLKALARLPEDRYPDAQALKRALEDWLAANQDAASSAHVAQFMRALYADRLAAGDDPLAGAGEPSRHKRTPTGRSRASPSGSLSRERLSQARAPVAPEHTTSLRPDRRSRSMRPVKAPTTSMRGAARERPQPAEPAAKITEVSRTGPSRAVPMGVGAVLIALACLVGAWAIWPEPGPDLPLATVTLRTDPPGATVVFNGQTVDGKTPLTLPQVPAGTYPVLIGMEKYRDLSVEVTVPATGNVDHPVLRLEPIVPESPVTPGPPQEVAVTIETTPRGAQLFVDGKPRGTSPAVVTAAPGSELSVRAELAGYQSLRTAVKVGTGPTQAARLALERRRTTARETRGGGETPASGGEKEAPARAMGTVRFAISPVGAWADVQCGPHHFGATPFGDKQLPAGTYDCTFTHPELGTKREKVEVRPNDLAKVTVKFN